MLTSDGEIMSEDQTTVTDPLSEEDGAKDEDRGDQLDLDDPVVWDAFRGGLSVTLG